MYEMEIVFPGGARVDALFGGYRIQTDQKRPDGSPGEAPQPFDLFIASIGTCAGHYVRSFFESRKLNTEGLKLIVHRTIDRERKRVSKLTIEVILPADFPDKYREAVKRAVDLCAVTRHILEPPEFETVVHKPDEN